MENILQEYVPHTDLEKFIDSFWFSRNLTGKDIDFPVVPDGCSDIIFYLNNSSQLPRRSETFISGAMEYAEIVPAAAGVELFGIRFKPAQLSYFLDIDMSSITNKMISLSTINKERYYQLRINQFSDNQSIINDITTQLLSLYKDVKIDDRFPEVVEKICKDPEVEITELADQSCFSVKSLERVCKKRIGYTPKKFARIMRFQKAHKSIQKQSVMNLITVAHQSGYFDQAHFNREYKKFVGYAPTSETLSILYNTKK